MTTEYSDDPRCPECGGAIGATATYCMHCSAEFSEEPVGEGDDNGSFWTGTEPSDNRSDIDESGDRRNTILDPDGLVDNALTTVIGLIGGLVVGVIGTVVLLILTSSSWGVGFGILAWIGATVHLVKQPTVIRTISRTCYGVAIVLLLIPLVAFGPSNEQTEFVTRIVVFVSMLGAVVLPAGLVAGIGFAIQRIWAASSSIE